MDGEDRADRPPDHQADRPHHPAGGGHAHPVSEVFDAGEELFRKLEHMHDLLIDPDRTSVRVVLTLERVVIKEAQRSFRTSTCMATRPTW